MPRPGAHERGDASIGTAADAVRAREGLTRGERVPPLALRGANGARRLGRAAEARGAEQTRVSGAAPRRPEDAWHIRSATGALGRREVAALGRAPPVEQTASAGCGTEGRACAAADRRPSEVDVQGTRCPRGLPDPRTAADDGTMRPIPSEQRRAVARAALARQNSLREMLLA